MNNKKRKVRLFEFYYFRNQKYH